MRLHDSGGAADDEMHPNGPVPSSWTIDRCFEAGLEALADPRGELELELIQSHMAQKPVLRGEVGCGVGPRDLGIYGDLYILLREINSKKISLTSGQL